MKYAKTEAGQRAFKERSQALSARQRSAFILFDGAKTVTEVLAATVGLGVSAADVEHLLAQGFIASVEPVPVAPAAAPLVTARTPQQRYAEAYPLAIQLVSSLGLRGFTLNLAVEAAHNDEELLALLPRLQQSLGDAACVPLERILRS